MKAKCMIYLEVDSDCEEKWDKIDIEAILESGAESYNYDIKIKVVPIDGFNKGEK